MNYTRYDAMERNEMHRAERDESRCARQSMSELERARGCDYPMRPCSCKGHDMSVDK